MTTSLDITPIAPHELALAFQLDAPRRAIWRCWTEPELLKQWFCPKPWFVSSAELDVRPGGASNVVMNGPNGEVAPNPGQYLEVVAEERLVFSDAFVGDWQPSPTKPFMVGEITMQDAPAGGTLYTARVRHWSAEDAATHEEMGFRAGWTIATEQLDALARTL
jgi:uncharacterized protein YndB with AHSA1/START domain